MPSYCTFQSFNLRRCVLAVSYLDGRTDVWLLRLRCLLWVVPALTCNVVVQCSFPKVAPSQGAPGTPLHSRCSALSAQPRALATPSSDGTCDGAYARRTVHITVRRIRFPRTSGKCQLATPLSLGLTRNGNIFFLSGERSAPCCMHCTALARNGKGTAR